LLQFWEWGAAGGCFEIFGDRPGRPGNPIWYHIDPSSAPPLHHDFPLNHRFVVNTTSSLTVSAIVLLVVIIYRGTLANLTQVATAFQQSLLRPTHQSRPKLPNPIAPFSKPTTYCPNKPSCSLN